VQTLTVKLNGKGKMVCRPSNEKENAQVERKKRGGVDGAGTRLMYIHQKKERTAKTEFGGGFKLRKAVMIWKVWKKNRTVGLTCRQGKNKEKKNKKKRVLQQTK